MIVRRWAARATAEGVQKYETHFRQSVLPELARIDGHRGAYLLQSNDDGLIEIIVLTLWTSMDAVRAFAGDAPEEAVVEPPAREALVAFDQAVSHHEVLVDTVHR